MAGVLAAAWTQKLHRAVAIRLTPANTSAMKPHSQEAKEWCGASCHAAALILAILLSRLKTQVVKKRTANTDPDEKKKKTQLNGLQHV